ncbi:MAG: RNA polymerase subunit sigma [Chloroflexota bacterium]
MASRSHPGRASGQSLIDLYFEDVGGAGRLTFEEERELGRRIAAGREAEAKLRTKRVSAKEVERLKQVIADAQVARDTLVLHNVRLVVSLARAYQGRGLPLGDLIQEGNLGLLQAAEHFDPERGFHFSTYAVWWIRQAILRALANKSRLIRLPVNVIDEVRLVQRAAEEMAREPDEQGGIEELAERTGLSPERVQHLLNVSRQPLELDYLISADSAAEFGQFIADPDAVLPEVESERAQLAADLEQALTTLPDREARILRLHYGLADGVSHSLSEIARFLNLSRERVRQLHSQALETLRRSQVGVPLADYLRG